MLSGIALAYVLFADARPRLQAAKVSSPTCTMGIALPQHRRFDRMPHTSYWDRFSFDPPDVFIPDRAGWRNSSDLPTIGQR